MRFIISCNTLFTIYLGQTGLELTTAWHSGIGLEAPAEIVTTLSMLNAVAILWDEGGKQAPHVDTPEPQSMEEDMELKFKYHVIKYIQNSSPCSKLIFPLGTEILKYATSSSEPKGSM